MLCSRGVRVRVWIALCALCSFAVPGAYADIERGAQLYDNHCRMCHEPEVHMRATRKVEAFDEIQRRVFAWSEHGGLDWHANDVRDVVEFLNERFYHFPQPR